MRAMNYLKKRMGTAMNRIEVASTMLGMKLRGNRGDSNLASILFITAVVIVIIVVIFFPQLRGMVEGAFDKSNEKLNSIWNYS